MTVPSPQISYMVHDDSDAISLQSDAAIQAVQDQVQRHIVWIILSSILAWLRNAFVYCRNAVVDFIHSFRSDGQAQALSDPMDKRKHYQIRTRKAYVIQIQNMMMVRRLAYLIGKPCED